MRDYMKILKMLNIRKLYYRGKLCGSDSRRNAVAENLSKLTFLEFGVI